MQTEEIMFFDDCIKKKVEIITLHHNPIFYCDIEKHGRL